VAEAEAVALDFDLDLGAPEAAQAPAMAPAAEVKSESAGLDINFDMPTKDSAAAGLDFPLAAETPAAAPEVPAAAPEVPAADSGSIDFEFDLGTPVAEAAPEPLSAVSLELPELAAAPAPAATPLDLGGISLELETPAASAGADAAQPDNPEVATKLELAMAYEEMGDRDGARELYQEALAEGSPAQQQAARAKLDGLG
jgi:pilus assembly protein FimV